MSDAKLKRDPISSRSSLVAAVEAAMKRVSMLSSRAEKLAPDTGAHYTLNAAWHKLDQAARLLEQKRERP